MLKIVVFDSGYGGELFADQLEAELPVVEVIRVIDWRHADQIQSSPTKARKLAASALRPYIGKVDLIIFANYLLTITSLKYFQRKYRNQQFTGLKLNASSVTARNTIVLTTKPVKNTLNYYNFLFHVKRKVYTITADDWPAKIDDGELSPTEVRQTIKLFAYKAHIAPSEIVLACAHFNDLKLDLRHAFGRTIKVRDSFNDTIAASCKMLKIRGGTGKRPKGQKHRQSAKH